MRLSLSVNDREFTKASLRTKGWLSAHVVLSNGRDEDESANRVWLNTIDLSESPNAIHSDWENVPLSIGDKILMAILPDGDADPPVKVTQTSDSANNLFSNAEQARLLLAAIQVCDRELAVVADRAASVEPDDEMNKIRIAIGTVLAEIDEQLISPTLRRHPELVAEEKKLR